MFVHILHLLWETLFLQTAVWVVFGTHSISRENTGKSNDGGEGTKVIGDIFTWRKQQKSMTRSSEHPEPELYLNTNSKYCLAEITHLGETLGRMQIGHCKSIPNTFASVDKKGKD